jgi:hypothetical protein
MSKDKTPGLRTYLKQAWDIAVERQKVHKALRLANKQMWSVEFLTALMQKAAKHYGTQLEMELVSPEGTRLVIRTSDAVNRSQYTDDDILNHLDDEVRIQQFLAQVQRRST